MESKGVSSSTTSPRNLLVAIGKWALALVLIVFLFRSGKLSPDHIARFFRSPVAAGASILGVLAITSASFLRWQLLLRTLGFHIGYWTAFRLGMTGAFFSTVIPGTIGGDLIKAVYVARRYPSAKLRAVSTIALDRISGLLAVLLLGGAAFVVGRGRITAIDTPSAKLVVAFGATLSLGALGILLCLGAYPFVARRLPEQLPRGLRALPGGKALNDLYRVFLDFRAKPYTVWLVVGVSLVFHLATFAIMGLIATTLFGQGPWGQIDASSFILGAVLGVCAMAIPVTPMGLGVGQLAFSEIFYALGAPDRDFGIGVITNYQILQLMIGLIGMIFFLSYRHESGETIAAAS